MEKGSDPHFVFRLGIGQSSMLFELSTSRIAIVTVVKYCTPRNKNRFSFRKNKNVYLRKQVMTFITMSITYEAFTVGSSFFNALALHLLVLVSLVLQCVNCCTQRETDWHVDCFLLSR